MVAAVVGQPIQAGVEGRSGAVLWSSHLASLVGSYRDLECSDEEAPLDADMVDGTLVSSGLLLFLRSTHHELPRGNVDFGGPRRVLGRVLTVVPCVAAGRPPDGMGRARAELATGALVIHLAVAVVVEAIADLRRRRVVPDAANLPADALDVPRCAQARPPGVAVGPALGIVLVGPAVAVIVEAVAQLRRRGLDDLDTHQLAVPALLPPRAADARQVSPAVLAAIGVPFVGFPVAVVVDAVTCLGGRAAGDFRLGFDVVGRRVHCGRCDVPPRVATRVARTTAAVHIMDGEHIRDGRVLLRDVGQGEDVPTALRRCVCGPAVSSTRFPGGGCIRGDSSRIAEAEMGVGGVARVVSGKRIRLQT